MHPRSRKPIHLSSSQLCIIAHNNDTRSLFSRANIANTERQRQYSCHTTLRLRCSPGFHSFLLPHPHAADAIKEESACAGMTQLPKLNKNSPTLTSMQHYRLGCTKQGEKAKTVIACLGCACVLKTSMLRYILIAQRSNSSIKSVLMLSSCRPPSHPSPPGPDLPLIISRCEAACSMCAVYAV